MGNRVKPLPTRFGTAQGHAKERQMVAQLDTDEFHTARRDNVDGSTTYVKTRGGFVHYWTSGDESQGAELGIIKRGFAVFIFVLASTQFINKGKTLISWVGSAWKRIKQDSVYAASTGYAVVNGKFNYVTPPLPDGVSAIQHIDQECYDVAMIHVPANGKRTLVVNAVPLRTLPDAVITGLPILTPVVVSGHNTYPKSNVDALGYHLFVVNPTRAQHLWNYANSVFGDYESSNGASLPPLSDVAGKTFDVKQTPLASHMWEVAYTKDGSTLLNVYHRYVQAELSLIPPYVTGGVPVVVQRPYYVYHSITTGAASGQSVTDTWDNHPDVPPIPVFDFFKASVTDATNGNPAYFNTYFEFNLGKDGPSVPGQGTGNSTDTRTFSNTVVKNNSYAVNSGKTLTVESSVSVDYTMVVGTGRMYQRYNNDGPNVEILNVESSYAIYASSYAGTNLQITADGAKTTYDNNAVTSVSHHIDGKYLFTFNSSMTFNSTTKSGWYATGRGQIGRGYLDGRLWSENNSWASGYGAATREIAMYALGWSYGIPDYAGNHIRYCGVDVYSNNDAATLIKSYYDSTPVFTFSRVSSATTKDYIFADDDNAVYVYVSGTFSGTNTGLNSVSGSSHAKVELVVEFAGNTRSIILYDSDQSNGCLVGTESFTMTINADYQPTHILPPGAPSIYVPRCEQGDFKYIAYTTAAEHSEGVQPRLLLSLPLYLAQREQNGNTYPAEASHAYVFVPYNLDTCSGMFGTGVFTFLQDKVFHVNASHEGLGDWLLKINVFGQTPDHYAECYRT
jgi:hypothetical protein